MQHCTFSKLKAKVSYNKISGILTLNSKPYVGDNNFVNSLKSIYYSALGNRYLSLNLSNQLDTQEKVSLRNHCGLFPGHLENFPRLYSLSKIVWLGTTTILVKCIFLLAIMSQIQVL